MKKIVSILLALLLICATAGVAEETIDLTAEVQSIYTALIAGNYAEIVERFDEAMHEAVDENQLAQGWAAILAQTGAYVDVQDIQTNEDTRSAQVTLACENGTALLSMVFDADGNIAGLGLQPQIAYEFSEKNLPEDASETATTLFDGTERALNASIVRPAGADADTAYVVLVHGSGPSDMDETIGGNKPFRDIAYDLAALGVGSLRFDKITYAHPEIGVETVTTEYLEPVAEAKRVLMAETAASRIYVAGHSEGGMLTPWLVQECGFDGGIALAGTPLPLWKISYNQNLVVLDSLPEEQRPMLIAQLDAEVEKAEKLNEMTDDEARATTLFGAPAYYQRSISQLDEIAIAKETQKPFLFLWGEADFQVDSDAHMAWSEGLGENDLHTYITYPGLNHLFARAESDDSILNTQAAYARTASVDPAIAQDIFDWIESLV